MDKTHDEDWCYSCRIMLLLHWKLFDDEVSITRHGCVFKFKHEEDTLFDLVKENIGWCGRLWNVSNDWLTDWLLHQPTLFYHLKSRCILKLIAMTRSLNFLPNDLLTRPDSSTCKSFGFELFWLDTSWAPNSLNEFTRPNLTSLRIKLRQTAIGHASAVY